MIPGSDDHLRDLQRRLADAHRRLDRVPARWAQGGSAPSSRVLVIGGGNAALIGSGLEGIQYASSFTAAAAYDPNVTTVYPSGLGWGYLFVNGVQKDGKVLIRHNFFPYPACMIAGHPVWTFGTTSVVFTPSGGGAVVNMTAYLLSTIQ